MWRRPPAPSATPSRLVIEYANSDGFRLVNEAVMCTDGGLEMFSSYFQQPDRGHRTSPLFRVALKLHSIESAQRQYNEWAAAQWDAQHSGSPGGWIDESGVHHELPRPANPFRESANA